MSAAPLQFLLLVFAGWVNRRQREVVEYLQEENRVLREQLGDRRLRFTDDQRRRLAANGRALGRRVLNQLGGLVTPDTILRWYRLLVAKKYDGSAKGRPGRPSTKPDLAALVARLANENPRGVTRASGGGLQHVGHDLARNTIKPSSKTRHRACPRARPSHAAEDISGRRIGTGLRPPTFFLSKC